MEAPETFHLFQQAAEALARGQPCALATVVGVQGSAYRHEGARMLVLADGSVLGAISGGCLESDVAEVARDAIRSGQPRLLRYDMTAADDDLWGLGLGCNGIVEVLVQPLLPDRPGQPAEGVETVAARGPGGPVTSGTGPGAAGGPGCQPERRSPAADGSPHPG